MGKGRGGNSSLAREAGSLPSNRTSSLLLALPHAFLPCTLPLHLLTLPHSHYVLIIPSPPHTLFYSPSHTLPPSTILCTFLYSFTVIYSCVPHRILSSRILYAQFFSSTFLHFHTRLLTFSHLSRSHSSLPLLIPSHALSHSLLGCCTSTPSINQSFTPHCQPRPPPHSLSRTLKTLHPFCHLIHPLVFHLHPKFFSITLIIYIPRHSLTYTSPCTLSLTLLAPYLFYFRFPHTFFHVL